jgi:hypothetical protein
MALLTNPTIVGPLNELTSPYGIRVQGQVVDAEVSVYDFPSNFLVARQTVTSSDQRIMLQPGVTLSPRMHLYAMQTLGGDSSLAPTGGDNFVGVHPEPRDASEIGSLVFRSRIFQCGRFLWVIGAIPGAMVEIEAGGVLLGSGPCLEGDARVSLTTPIPHSGTVFARQIVGAFPPGPSRTLDVGPIPLLEGRNDLPAPSVQQPVRGCDSSILVSDVYDGALVHVESRDTAGVVVDTEEAGFDLSSLRMIMGRPMQENETFTIRQEVSKQCERFPLWSSVIKVGSVKPVDAPIIEKPLCVGGSDVGIRNLRGNSKVYITNNGKVYTGQTLADATSASFKLSGLLEPGTVTATQEICGVMSPISNTVTVDASHQSFTACEIVPRLFACSTKVSVTNIHPPSSLEVCEVINDELYPISNQEPIFQVEATIDVPSLREGQELQVRQWACSDMSILSQKMRVEPAPHLPVPYPATPVFTHDKSIEILATVAGASVELYLIREGQAVKLAGSAIATNISDTIIEISDDLRPGDELFCRQFLCSEESSKDFHVILVADPAGPRPFYRIGHNPNDFETVVEQLGVGANALEPDVNRHTSSNDLYISHGLAGDDNLTLTEYLDQLHTVAVANPQLALIMFDCKSPACSQGNGLILLKAIREHLTFDLPLNIIISIASLDDASMFELIYPILRSREGLQVDQYDNVVAVADYFSALGIHSKCFGYGNTVQEPHFTPHLRPNIEEGVGLKGGEDRFKWVYEWSDDDPTLQHQFIYMGVDGIIADTVIDLPLLPTVPSLGLANLRIVTEQPEFLPVIRIATRKDNPFKPPNANYVIAVHTGDVLNAATDANITYTLTGTLGTAAKVIDASLAGTYSRDQWDYVTVQSGDIGPLTSITVVTDGTGWASGWFLDRVQIRSWRWGVSKDATFNQWIDTTPVTKSLV